MREALHGQRFPDGKGNQVKRNHALYRESVGPDGEIKQTVKWIDIDTASPEDYAAAEAWRRMGMANDATQLTVDRNYFVEKNPGSEEVLGQLSLDFTDDAAERLDHSGGYPEARPPEEADEEEEDDGGSPVGV